MLTNVRVVENEDEEGNEKENSVDGMVFFFSLLTAFEITLVTISHGQLGANP
jgi:hypothetical protein